MIVEFDDIVDEINCLRELKQNALAESAQREGLKQKIAEMTEFLNEQTEKVEEYDEQLVRLLVEKVTVYEGGIKVEFKSGGGCGCRMIINVFDF